MPYDTLRERVETRLVSITVRDPKLAADPAVQAWIAGVERALTRELMDQRLRALERLVEPAGLGRASSPWWRDRADD